MDLLNRRRHRYSDMTQGSRAKCRYDRLRTEQGGPKGTWLRSPFQPAPYLGRPAIGDAVPCAILYRPLQAIMVNMIFNMEKISREAGFPKRVLQKIERHGTEVRTCASSLDIPLPMYNSTMLLTSSCRRVNGTFRHIRRDIRICAGQLVSSDLHQRNIPCFLGPSADQ